jgi:iron complex transport system substrate-binding protein
VRALAVLVLAAMLAALAHGAGAGTRVFSLDQCADQYVLALSPRADIVGLSKRATNADSYLRAEVGTLPRHRATSESVLAARPAVVIRYWGGDDRLLADLKRRHVRVIVIDDATDFPGIRVNVRRVAAALDGRGAGEGLIARMDARLAAARGARGGAGALYLTSGGATTGSGTLMDAMLRAAGLTNLAPGRGFHSLSVEALILHPPSALVLGFFGAAEDVFQYWSMGRLEPLRRLAARRAIVSLPASVLGCPAWFTADGSLAIARAPRKGEGII